MNALLRAFVIGSSCLVFLPFFYFVSRFQPSQFHFQYKDYTFLAPIGLGFMNLLSLLIAERFHLSKRQRFFYTSIIAPSLLLLTVWLAKIYTYTWSDWVSHIVYTFIMYSIVCNFVLYYLDKYV